MLKERLIGNVCLLRQVSFVFVFLINDIPGNCIVMILEEMLFSVLCVTEYSTERMSKHNAPQKQVYERFVHACGCHVNDGHSGEHRNVHLVSIVWSVLR